MAGRGFRIVAGPRRVGDTAGRPQEEKRQRQPQHVISIPIQRGLAGGDASEAVLSHTSTDKGYELGKSVIVVTTQSGYTPGTALEVRHGLGYNPEYVQVISAEPSTGGEAYAYPVDRETWTAQRVKVACSVGGVVRVTLKVY